MVVPELGSGIWVGIGFGVLGIAFWVVGLYVFDKLVDRYANEGPPDNDSVPRD